MKQPPILTLPDTLRCAVPMWEAAETWQLCPSCDISTLQFLLQNPQSALFLWEKTKDLHSVFRTQHSTLYTHLVHLTIHTYWKIALHTFHCKNLTPHFFHLHFFLHIQHCYTPHFPLFTLQFTLSTPHSTVFIPFQNSHSTHRTAKLAPSSWYPTLCNPMFHFKFNSRPFAPHTVDFAFDPLSHDTPQWRPHSTPHSPQVKGKICTPNFGFSTLYIPKIFTLHLFSPHCTFHIRPSFTPHSEFWHEILFLTFSTRVRICSCALSCLKMYQNVKIWWMSPLHVVGGAFLALRQNVGQIQIVSKRQKWRRLGRNFGFATSICTLYVFGFAFGAPEWWRKIPKPHEAFLIFESVWQCQNCWASEPKCSFLFQHVCGVVFLASLWMHRHCAFIFKASPFGRFQSVKGGRGLKRDSCFCVCVMLFFFFWGFALGAQYLCGRLQKHGSCGLLVTFLHCSFYSKTREKNKRSPFRL